MSNILKILILSTPPQLELDSEAAPSCLTTETTELQKWYSTKFDSTLHQELNEAIRWLLKASYNPLPQGSGAISGGF